MKTVQRGTISLLLILVKLICLLSSCSTQDMSMNTPSDIDISSAAEITFPLIIVDGIMYALECENASASTREFVSLNIQTEKAKKHGEVADYTISPSGNCQVLGNRIYKTFAAKDALEDYKVYLYELSQDNIRQEFIVTNNACSGLNYIEASDKYIYVKCLFLEGDNDHLIARIMKFDPITKNITTFIEEKSTTETRVGEQILYFAYNSVSNLLSVLLCTKNTPDGEMRYYIDSYDESGTFMHRNDITELCDEVVNSAISKMTFYGNNLFIRDWSNNILLAEYDIEEDCYKPKIVSDIEFSLQPAIGKLDSSDGSCDYAIFRFTGLEEYRFLVLLDVNGNTLKYSSLSYLGLADMDIITSLFVDGNNVFLYYEDHDPDEEYGIPRSQQKYEIKFVKTTLADLLENTFFEQAIDSNDPIMREKLFPTSLQDE